MVEMLLWTVLTLAILNALYLLVMIPVMRVTGSQSVVATLFIGPRLFRLHFGWLELHVRSIPLTAYLTGYQTSGVTSTSPETEQDHSIKSISRWAGFASLLTSVFGFCSLALLVLTPEEAAQSFADGWWQVPAGGFYFWGLGKSRISDALHLFQREGAGVCMAMFATKVAAFNCIPSSINPVGMFLQQCIPVAERRMNTVNTLSFLATILIGVGWCVAAVWSGLE